MSARSAPSPTGYRRRWGLPKNYPMAAPNYAAFHSVIGRALGRRELAPIGISTSQPLTS
ncbi:MucR family transcriptional regulator [Aureimonas phyllosphaerae]|uniref:MucR family transcriptional regulator n=1 Tax=Aureimonas phyllosphaerae TaxID=1166078 RepID=UPI000B83E5AB